jgi:hypothetical protein
MLDLDPDFRLAELPRKVTLVRDLEEYEGPILSEYKATYGSAAYVEKFCARSGNVCRYLLVRSDQRAIAEFLGGRLSMLSLLRDASDGVGFLIDRNQTETTAVHIAPFAGIPKAYLPTPARMHNEDLRPSWSIVPQSYLIDEHWDSSMFATIERNYFNAAGFAYLTKPNTDRALPSKILEMDFDGGYPVMHAFNAIRAAVPEDQRSRPGGVNANSPGVLTINAPSETAERLGAALQAHSRSYFHYHAVHQWSRLTPNMLEGLPALDVARQNVRALCEALNVDPAKLYPKQVAPDREAEAVLIAGKLITAYYRVLHRVLDPVQGVEFVGVQIERLQVDSIDELLELEEREDDVLKLGRGSAGRRALKR